MLTHLYVTSVAQVLSSGSRDTKVKSLFQDTLIQMLDKLIQDFIVTCSFITAAIAGKEILKRPPKYNSSKSEIKRSKKEFAKYS